MGIRRLQRSTDSRAEGKQPGQSDAIAGHHRQGETGADAFDAAQHRLGHATDGLGPTEGFPDLLAAFLRQGVTGVAGGAPVPADVLNRRASGAVVEA